MVENRLSALMDIPHASEPNSSQGQGRMCTEGRTKRMQRRGHEGGRERRCGLDFLLVDELPTGIILAVSPELIISN